MIKILIIETPNLLLYNSMRSFKEFFMSEYHGVGASTSYKDKTFGLDPGSWGHDMPRSAWSALMGSRRRQLLDPNDPIQFHQLVVTLLNNLISDVDTGNLFGNKTSHVNKLVYEPIELARKYSEEEQNLLKNSRILEQASGFSASDISKWIYAQRDPEMEIGLQLVERIQSNNLTAPEMMKLFGSPSYPFRTINGLSINIEQLEYSLKNMEKVDIRDRMVARGIQGLNHSVLSPMSQAAATSRINDPSRDVNFH